jgi:hypothetical protein
MIVLLNSNLKLSKKKTILFYFSLYLRFHDENFREECTKMYLDERTQYRETGVLRKAIRRSYYLNPQKVMDRINKIRREYERLEHKDH